MNYDERKAEARELVIRFLNSGLTPPRGVCEAGQAELINNIADAFARKMPLKGDYREACHNVFTRVRDTHMSSTWPTQAVFVLAMPSADAMHGKAAESFRVTDYAEHYSEQMRLGEYVPEGVIWGSMAARLPRRELERYRNASVMGWVEAYRMAAPDLMEAKYGPVVREYFRQEAVQ